MGYVGKNCGVTRPLVNRSKAYAYLISDGSENARPKNAIPTAVFSRSPSGTVIYG